MKNLLNPRAVGHLLETRTSKDLSGGGWGHWGHADAAGEAPELEERGRGVSWPGPFLPVFQSFRNQLILSVGATINRGQPLAVQSTVVEAQWMDSEPIWPSAYFTQHLSSFILQPMFSTFKLHSPPFPQTGRGTQSPISHRLLFDFRIYWWASPLPSRSRCDFLWPGDLGTKL